MKKLKKHIIYDIIFTWIIVLGCVCYGFVGSFLFHLIALPFMLCIAIYRTFFWGKIFCDLKFSEPDKIVTKGFRDFTRQTVYFADFNGKIRYSEIRFSDPRLSGKYIYFDEAAYRGGDELEITYYKRSKYIVDIQRLKAVGEYKKAPQDPLRPKLKRSVRPRNK